MKKLRGLFDASMLKFLLVGVLNTLVGSGIMFLLYNLADAPYWMSVCANYIVGGVVSYFLNKYFTFQNRERSWAQVARFVLTVAVCALIAYGVAKPLVRWALSGFGVKVQDNAAMLVGMCLYTGLNYFGQRFFAFRPAGGASQPDQKNGAGE